MNIRAVVLFTGVIRISRITVPVTVGVGAEIAHITNTVTVGISLIGIIIVYTIIADITNTVGIAVFLVRIEHLRTVVRCFRYEITIHITVLSLADVQKLIDLDSGQNIDHTAGPFDSDGVDGCRIAQSEMDIQAALTEKTRLC